MYHKLIMVFRDFTSSDILKEVTGTQLVNTFLEWHEYVLVIRLPSTLLCSENAYDSTLY